MKKRTVRIDNICFRWTTPIGSKIEYPEIVKWYFDNDLKKEVCYTLSSWSKTKDYWNLKDYWKFEFYRDRPFALEKDEQEIFWKLAKECHELINSED